MKQIGWIVLIGFSWYLKSKRDIALQPSEHLFIDSNKRYVDNQTEHDCR